MAWFPSDHVSDEPVERLSSVTDHVVALVCVIARKGGLLTPPLLYWICKPSQWSFVVAEAVTGSSRTPTLTLPPPWLWLSDWTFFMLAGEIVRPVTRHVGGSVVVVVVVVVVEDVEVVVEDVAGSITVTLTVPVTLPPRLSLTV